MVKKLIHEDSIETKAGDTIVAGVDRGNASHEGDPKSRFETLATMIGSAHAMRDDELTKWWTQAVNLIGKEGNLIPGGTKEKNSSSIDMKKSDAPVSSVSKHSYSEAMPKLKEAIQQDLTTIFDSQEGLTEDFKTKAAVLFETAVMTLVQMKEEEMKEAMGQEFDEEVNTLVVELAEATDEFLDHIAEQWFEENEVAIESTLRNELSEEFILGLKNLFIEHFIDIPQEKIDIVDSLAQKVDELEAQLSDVLSENSELQKVVDESIRDKIVAEAVEGLTLADAEKLIELSEAVDADSSEEFADKIQVIRESNFIKSGSKKTTITEQMEEVDEDNKLEETKEYSSPQMAHYASAITRGLRK